MSDALGPRKGTVIAILIFLTAISVIFVTREGARPNPVGRAIQTALAPFQYALTQVVEGVVDTWRGVVELSSLRQENARLRRENARLRAENLLLEQFRRENEQWRRMLAFQEQAPWKTVAAQVIARDPSNWFSLLTINKGERDGIKPRQPVITEEGLVGQVRHTGPHWATVLLILDSRSAIGGQVERTGDFVLVEGRPDVSGFLVARPLSPGVELKEGDLLLTAGLTPLFPKGLQIGTVVSLQEGKYGLSKVGLVRPAVRFSNLEKVFVIVDSGLAAAP
ncbi:MAG: rod shape-determining protein MreC [Bacillota bacterium]|nr:rod shape-determining protein MreC [Bacillota bacterium]